MSPWWLLFGGWLVMAVVMVLVWLLQRWSGDAGIVDVMWSAGVGALGVVYAALSSGDPWRRLLIGLMAGIWGLRLALYLLQRVRRLPEDGRYTTMRQDWGEHAQRNLFIFFQVQAFWSVLFAVPMLIAAANSAPPGWLDGLGLVIWIISVAGETIADRQLGRFRLDPDNRGKVCRRGLWYYSRHPNYFFEWLHWWAYVCLGLLAPWGWLTLGGPLVMLYFLFKVTGIPPTEAQAVRTRGEAYRDYQRTTSVFFPWPPRRSEVAL